MPLFVEIVTSQLRLAQQLRPGLYVALSVAVRSARVATHKARIHDELREETAGSGCCELEAVKLRW
jgi:hypothetical protein